MRGCSEVLPILPGCVHYVCLQYPKYRFPANINIYQLLSRELAVSIMLAKATYGFGNIGNVQEQ